MNEMNFIVRVFGYSDDLVDIEGSSYPEFEIDCFDRDVRLWFDDGTIILVSYSQDGIWKICVEKQGYAPQKLTACEDEDSDIYSDVFEINAEVVKHQVVRKGIKTRGTAMTLDEAIAHAEEVAGEDPCTECSKEHGQLAEWLRMLDGVNKIADEYGVHQTEWTDADSADAFHRILRIIGRG